MGSAIRAGTGPPVLLPVPCPEIHDKCLHLKSMEDRHPKRVVSVGEDARRGESSSSGWCVGAGRGCGLRRCQLDVCRVKGLGKDWG